MIHQAPLEAGAEWAYSSVVEHCVDIAGVASSILATPTIFSFAMSFSEIGILFPIRSNGTDLMLEANPHIDHFGSTRCVASWMGFIP